MEKWAHLVGSLVLCLGVASPVASQLTVTADLGSNQPPGQGGVGVRLELDSDSNEVLLWTRGEPLWDGRVFSLSHPTAPNSLAEVDYSRSDPSPSHSVFCWRVRAASDNLVPSLGASTLGWLRLNLSSDCPRTVTVRARVVVDRVADVSPAIIGGVNDFTNGSFNWEDDFVHVSHAYEDAGTETVLDQTFVRQIDDESQILVHASAQSRGDVMSTFVDVTWEIDVQWSDCLVIPPTCSPAFAATTLTPPSSSQGFVLAGFAEPECVGVPTILLGTQHPNPAVLPPGVGCDVCPLTVWPVWHTELTQLISVAPGLPVGFEFVAQTACVADGFGVPCVWMGRPTTVVVGP